VVVLSGEVRIACDSVVLAGEIEAADEFVRELRQGPAEVIAIGDCTGLGLIRKAIEEGARAGAAI